MAINVIMLGPPGAGKGTQAERFARARDIPRISTGDILRDAVTAGSEIGRKVKATMDRGDLVGDDVMIGIVTERLKQPDAAGGFVLDGFPRTVAQASALDQIMDGRDPLIVIDIVVPEAELVRRLGSRMICESCGTNADSVEIAAGDDGGGNSCRRCGGRLKQRSDDGDAVVRERLKVYERATKPLVEFYRSRPTFRAINGAQQPDRVAVDLERAVNAASASGGAQLTGRRTAQ
jgi:adenylate kinase